MFGVLGPDFVLSTLSNCTELLAQASPGDALVKSCGPENVVDALDGRERGEPLENIQTYVFSWFLEAPAISYHIKIV